MNIKIVLSVTLILLTFSMCKNQKTDDLPNLDDGYSEKLNSNNLEVGVTDQKGMKQGIWKEFNSSKALKAVSFYQDDSIVAELNSEDFIFQPLEFGKGRFTVNMPKVWKTSNNSEYLLVLVKDTSANGGHFRPNVVIGEIYQDSKQLDTVFDEFIADTKSKYEKFGIQTVLDLKVDGRNAKYLLYAVRVNNVNILGSFCLISNNDKLININMMAGLYDDKDVYLYKGLFEEIIASFTFLD